MKVLVTFYSLTGNTEKLARAIFDAIAAEKDILPVKDVKNLDAYDLIFCGFPVNTHSVPPSVADFIKKLPPRKKLAIFSTHGSVRGGHLAVTAMEQAMSLALKSKVVGTFACRGKVSQRLIDELMKKPEHRAWALEAQSADTHPDKADFEDARDFVRDIMRKVSTM